MRSVIVEIEGAEYCPFALLDIRYFRYLIRALSPPPPPAEIEAKNAKDLGSGVYDGGRGGDSL